MVLMMLKRFFLIFLFAALLPAAAEAKDPKPTIRDDAYSARFVSQSIVDPIVISAGETQQVTIRFRNTGTATWNATGARYVSAYTVEPRDRASLFRSPSWTSSKQTAAILKSVKPGETGEVTIALSAPATSGTYEEEFYLAAENYSWVAGGYFYLKINVVPNTKATPDPVPATAPSSAKANSFLQSPKVVEAKGGDPVPLIIGFQNMGTGEWKRYGLVLKQEISVAAAMPSFADATWADPIVVFRKDKVVSRGGTTRDEVLFRAPRTVGTYTAIFHLEVDGAVLDEPVIEIPITVTDNAPDHYVEPFGAGQPLPPQAYLLPEEPRIRVGLWQSPEFVQFRSEDDEYNVFSGQVQVGVLPRQQFGILKMENGQYSFHGGGREILSDDYIRLSPTNNPHASFILWNYTRRVSWKGPGNFNRYRGAFEFRRGETRANIWVVNDLLLEDYVRGIAENSNGAPSEYLKAQTVAQRSYAYATIQSNKYGIFDVVATTGDQLYLGIESERITPNFVAAADATRGVMVRYENNVVLTPYFANSDCRTRSWTEVWGGSVKPWLTPVKTTYDCAAGRGKKGHGVGMSQLDASARAKQEGLDFAALLHYYYTDVSIERLYE